MSVFQKLLRAGEGKKIRALESLVPEINAVEADYENLSDDELRAKTGDFKLEIERGADIPIFTESPSILVIEISISSPIRMPCSTFRDRINIVSLFSF